MKCIQAKSSSSMGYAGPWGPAGARPQPRECPGLHDPRGLGITNIRIEHSHRSQHQSIPNTWTLSNHELPMLPPGMYLFLSELAPSCS